MQITEMVTLHQQEYGSSKPQTLELIWSIQLEHKHSGSTRLQITDYALLVGVVENC